MLFNSILLDKMCCGTKSRGSASHEHQKDRCQRGHSSPSHFSPPTQRGAEDTHPWPPGLRAGRSHSMARSRQSSAHTPWWSGLWEGSMLWGSLLCPARSSPPWEQTVTSCKLPEKGAKTSKMSPSKQITTVQHQCTRVGSCDSSVLVSVLPLT